MTSDPSTSTSQPSRPLAPRIRLRVGVSGHRGAPKLPAEAVPDVREGVDQVLLTIANAARKVAVDFSDKASQLTIVSALADGSDRIVAEAGLAAAFNLESVLPFARAEYVRDFKNIKGSHAVFAALIERASAIFELDGNPSERPRAYEAAGFVMLANTDLLIAIWDGNEADGVGGTAQIVGRAIADGIPVVRIDPANPNDLQLSWPRAGELPLANALATLFDP